MIDLTRLMMTREAIASVALSHDEDCPCEVCRAAAGNVEVDLQELMHNKLTDAGTNPRRR